MPKPEITEELVRAAFDHVLEPSINWNLNALNLVKRVELDDRKVWVDVNLITDDVELITAFRATVDEAMSLLRPDEFHLRIRRVDVTTEGTSGVRRVLLVGSGKGGVGKSSVAVNLAAALQALGHNVGLMDADVHGPSIPTMLGQPGRPEALPENYLMPVSAYGMKTMSIGYIMGETQAIDWRGTLASGTLLQFIQRTFWGELDYLVVDLPPGTGDIQLTLAERLNSDGVVVVSTPQEVVLGDVRRSVALFNKKQIPVLGIVENMGFVLCESCGHHNMPFNRSERTVEDDPLAGIDKLTSIPLAREISNAADSGRPIALHDGENAYKDLFHSLAKDVVVRLEEACAGRKEQDEHIAAELKAGRLDRAEQRKSAPPVG
ncbi:MAG: P-loop NTPase [Deltaproteobacteria bacterium]|jgi:ATP-binding protein involved in chromosome partitioning|nr:P-loop NTPase [Deltaproteobacteria bacterium]